MREEEFHWKTTDGLQIYGRYWAPDDNIKGVVCLVHGMGEHCSRYAHVGKLLVEQGIALISFDQRGHGKSEGKRGHTPSYELLMQSIDDLLAKAAEYFPQTPIVLYGHSMGGNLVLNYVLKRKPQIKGVIASSPWLRLAFEPPAIQVKLGEIVNKILPAFTQSTKLDASTISRIPEEVKKYKDDPLVHDKISTMFFISVKTQGEWALANASKLRLPLLIFHGTGDLLTSYTASKEFVDNTSKEDVTLKLFDGAYHEIHNDLNQKDLFDLVTRWLDSHF